jgi:hypothetical protein
MQIEYKNRPNTRIQSAGIGPADGKMCNKQISVGLMT